MRSLGNPWDEESHMESPLKITNLVTDKYVSKILLAVHKKPKCAQDISRICDIPIAACYRRINELEKLGFLRCTENRLNIKGKRVRYYLSQIKQLHLFLENGRFRLKIKLANGDWNFYNEEKPGLNNKAITNR